MPDLIPLAGWTLLYAEDVLLWAALLTFLYGLLRYAKAATR